MRGPRLATTIMLKPITVENWEIAADLLVKPEQEDFLTPNVKSIAESKFHPELMPLGIFANGNMVGFSMHAVTPEDNQLWIVRFMIAAEHQGKGYGTLALRKLLARLAVEHRDREHANIGYHTQNSAAERLYLAAGGERMGAAPWGGDELVIRVPLPKA